MPLQISIWVATLGGEAAQSQIRSYAIDEIDPLRGDMRARSEVKWFRPNVPQFLLSIYYNRRARS